LTYECSGSTWAGVVAALIMAVIPAHTMRSIAGGYDNESLAVTAMILTFYSWARSNRNEKSWPLGAVAGLCYVYMVAAWGGYTFVLNMVGLHAAALVALNHYTGVHGSGDDCVRYLCGFGAHRMVWTVVRPRAWFIHQTHANWEPVGRFSR
jgi:hypothetical protein